VLADPTSVTASFVQDDEGSAVSLVVGVVAAAEYRKAYLNLFVH